MDAITWCIDNWEQVLVIALATCGVAAHITALTPTKKDDAVVSKILSVLNFIGGNYGKAKNAEPAEKPEDKPVV